MNEIWKPIIDYEGIYEISNRGNIRSLPRNYVYGNITKPTILKPNEVRGGYHRVALYKNGKRTQYMVHRLVAQAFVPNTNNKPIVNHLDTDPKNNHSNNLEWCTSKENSNHADCPKKISAKVSKAVIKCDIDGTPIKIYPSMTAAAKILERVNISEISKCVRDNSKTAGGYKWRLSNVKN